MHCLYNKSCYGILNILATTQAASNCKACCKGLSINSQKRCSFIDTSPYTFVQSVLKTKDGLFFPLIFCNIFACLFKN